LDQVEFARVLRGADVRRRFEAIGENALLEAVRLKKLYIQAKRGQRLVDETLHQ
jgi:hypothetical protein